MGVNVVWEPIPNSSQGLAITCPAKEILYSGNRGVGKTDLMLARYALGVNQGFGSEYVGVIFRTEYKGLESIKKKGINFFGKIFPGVKFKESPTAYKFVFPKGEELLLRFGSKEDDYKPFHGQEYPFIAFDELTNWADSVFYDNVITCCRCSIAGVPKVIFATTNSYGVGHSWVKEKFVVPDRKGGTIITNETGNTQCVIYGSLLENFHLLNADPTYINTLKAIKNKAKRMAWLYGDWDLQAGGFYDEVWDPDFHVIEPFDIPRTWKIDRSHDWGKSHPFATYWWAESDGSPILYKDGSRTGTTKGDLFCIYEHYGCVKGEANVGLKMSPSIVADMTKNIDARIEKQYNNAVRPGPADSQIFATDAEKTIATYMQERGVSWEKVVKGPGSRPRGWAVVGDMLETSILKLDSTYFRNKGYPEQEDSYILNKRGLYFFNNCEHAIRTVSVLKQDPKNLDDVQTDCEDHAWDAIRYRCTHRMGESSVASLYG